MKSLYIFFGSMATIGAIGSSVGLFYSLFTKNWQQASEFFLICIISIVTIMLVDNIAGKEKKKSA